MAYDNIKAVIEALLFASEKPLTLEQIKNVLESLDTGEIRRLLSEMQAEYETANRGIRIIEVAEGFRMSTAATLAPFLKKLYKQRRVERLSRQALETLAIIAYKQPVTKLEIESIRNVGVDGVMQGLLEKDIIRVAGRKKAPGRPKVYGTTRQFLEYFGLKSLEDLPKIGGLTAPQELKEETTAKEEMPNAVTKPA
jgi:segregation and condensation protein B